ncbi:MAG: glycoside hydrolase family 3 N-terminal domain-containing protein [Sarcina sp.]
MKKKKFLSLFMIVAISVSIIGCGTQMEASKKISDKDVVEVVDEEIKIDVEKKVKEVLSKMTIEEKIGQLLMVDFRTWNGENFTEINEEVSQVISSFNLGGVILFAENIKSTEQTVKLCDGLQNSVSNREVPLFIGVDQEGGIVSRMSMGISLSGNMSVGATGSQGVAYEYGDILGKELDALGINVNFAPVLDVNSNPNNPVIGTRSLSSNPSIVSSLGAEMAKGIEDNNVIAGAKHFPGHGDTNIDSHVGLPRVDKTREELDKTEFLPFRENIKNLDMIMTAHIEYPQIEKDKKGKVYLPATLSDDLITGVLRKDMGFDGVVITDAMNMEAISDNFGEVEAVKMAIKAGVDIVLMPTTLTNYNDVEKLERIINGLLDAIESGEISMKRLDESVERILKLKYERGIFNFDEKSLEERVSNAKKVVASDEHRQKEREIAAKSITVLKNDGVLPLKVNENENILLIASNEGRINSMKFGVDRLVSEKKMPNVNIDTYNYQKQSNLNKELKDKINKADAIIILTEAHGTSQMKKGHYLRELPRKVLDYSKENNKKPIFASVANPYNAGLYKDAPAQLLTYGSAGMDPTENLKELPNSYSPNIPAVIDIIFGAYNTNGKLPVDIPKVSNNGSLDTGILEYKIGDGIEVKK